MQSPVISSAMKFFLRAAAPLALVGSLPLGGCIFKTAPQKPKFVRTGATQPPLFRDAQTDAPPPDVAPNEVAAAPIQFVITVPERPAPPRRVVASSEPEPEPTKPAPLQISPQLSQQEISRLQGDIENDLRAARLNLNSVVSKRMNSFQQELADKVHSFMDQTRDAQNSADWVRARSLAEKARIVSEDLVRSF
jgi:hypothetical protein